MDAWLLLSFLLLIPAASSAADCSPRPIPDKLPALTPLTPTVSYPPALASPRPRLDIIPPQAFAAASSLPAPQPQPGLAPGARERLAGLDAEISRSKPGDVPSLLDQSYDGAPRAPPEALSVALPENRATIPIEQALTRLEINAPLLGVSGSFRVDISHSGRHETITAPQASALAAAVARAMPAGALKDASVTEIVVVSAMSELETLQESPTGKARRSQSAEIAVDQDAGVDFRRLYVLRSALKDDFSFKTAPEPSLFKAAGAAAAREVPVQRERRLGPLLKPHASVFVGGLISISAEPPEGFFAAATASELKAKGYGVTSAQRADVWLYRVPDSRPESYFDFRYPSADRPADTPRKVKFKIASGIGPAHNPASTGGGEADLLWLGDEQNGALEAFLKTLSKPDLAMADLYARKGFVQRLSPTEVVVGGIDHAHAMTSAGFDAMETSPEIYRRIYSEEYDKYLLSLFDHPKDAESLKSYLLATSRGCSQGCAICCSGGLSKFQFFSAPRMLRELEKIAAHARLKPGEAANIFFVDSNFNNNPKRLIEFANLYEKSGLSGKFHFYVRHNTVNGFLKPGPEGSKVPNIELIDAYARLGIRQVFMGVDSYDDAGTLTLKSNRNLLAKNGAAMRPTYTSEEVRSLVRAFESRGLASRGFFITNNPWVGDLDRIDGYYNLFELWLENPHFSVDTSNRNAHRLQPFAGSPIADIAAKMEKAPVKDGRFIAKGALGEMDELMEFSVLDAEAGKKGAAAGIEQFRASINRLREASEKTIEDPASRLIVQKLLVRDARLARLLKDEPAADGLLDDIARFAGAHRGLAAFDPADQKKAFEAASSSLISGLAGLRSPSPAATISGSLSPASALTQAPPSVLARLSQGWLRARAILAAALSRLFDRMAGFLPAGDSQVLAPGTMLHSYTVRKFLGSGGQSNVYVVTSPDGRRWALKQPGWGGNGTSLRTEFGILSKLEHPNLPRVRELFEIEGRAYLVEELVEGATLERAIADGPLSPEQALRLAKQLLETLDYLHKRRIGHHDIKLQNVMLREDGSLCLIDFGLAGIVDSHRDILEAGRILYSLSTGQQPSLWKTPRMVDPSIPLDFSDAIMKALNPGSKTPFPDAPSFLIALEDSIRNAPVEPLAPGSILGSYRIKRMIDSGGQSWVYHATSADGRDWALKEASGGVQQEDLTREYALLSTLEHPNLPRVKELLTYNGRHFMVHELVEGATLERAVADGPLSPKQALRLAKPLLETLDYLHKRGIGHHDVKLKNVMLRGDGSLCLIDFGFARLVKHVDKALDLRRSGELLYRLLTGKPPVQDDRKLTRRQLAPDIPQAFGDAVMKAMSESDPFPDALSMLDALEKALRRS